MDKGTRRYSMAQRAARAEETKKRIHDASIQLLREKPQGFTLKEVAARARTSVQTVLRLFGSKAALAALALEEGQPPLHYPETPQGNVAGAIRLLYDQYEEAGDRLIAQFEAEHRYPALAARIEAGRHDHRAWVERVFAPQLGTRSGPAHQSLLYGLLVATDLQVWKVLRRDQGLYRGAAEAMTRHIVNALLRVY